MSKNIRHIMRSSVYNSFQEGRDKHSLRKEGMGDNLTISYGARNQLLDRVNDLCKCLPKEIRSVTEIRPEHLQTYLEEKGATCSQRTVDEYRTEIRKLGKILGVDWAPEKVVASRKGTVANRGARDVISKEDWQKLLEYCETHLDVSSNAVIVLEKYLGVRVSDICYGIVDKGDVLEINSKNGKILTVPVTAELRSFLEKPEIQNCFIGNKFKPCKDNTVNKQLARVEDRLGIPRKSFHAIRRRIAQDRYDTLRMSGVSRKEALSVVSLSLNHGAKRDRMLAQSYIGDIW